MKKQESKTSYSILKAYRKLTTSNMLKIGLICSIFLVTGSAFAMKDNAAALKDMADTADKFFNGDLMKIAINGGGLAAVIFSIIGGFKPGPFLGGLALLIFYGLYSAYTTKLFA